LAVKTAKLVNENSFNKKVLEKELAAKQAVKCMQGQYAQVQVSAVAWIMVIA